MSPLVSVIVPVYNGMPFVDTCFDSLLQEPPDLMEIIAIVDKSTDGSYEYLQKKYKKSKQFHLLRQIQRGGTVKGINMGVAIAKAPYLFIVGQDSEVMPGWAEKISFFFKTHPMAAVGQVKMLKTGTNEYDYAGDFISPFGFLVERARGAVDRGQYDKTAAVFSVKGGGMIVRRDIYQQLGGMDATYFFGWEEPDFTWRCWMTGYEVYFFPDVTLYHAFGTKKKEALQQYYLREANIFYHGCKNHLTSLISLLEIKNAWWMAIFVFSIYAFLSLLFLLHAKWHKSLSILKGLIWVVVRVPFILKRRKKMQQIRIKSDSEIFERVGVKQSLFYYVGKAIAYVQGRAY